jgi:hypothetical protein
VVRDKAPSLRARAASGFGFDNRLLVMSVSMSTCSPSYRICMMLRCGPMHGSAPEISAGDANWPWMDAITNYAAGLGRLELPSLSPNLVVPENRSGAR